MVSGPTTASTATAHAHTATARSMRGEWREGRRASKGFCMFANGDRYEGHWAEDRPDGQGKCQYTTGENFEVRSFVSFSAVWVSVFVYSFLLLALHAHLTGICRATGLAVCAVGAAMASGPTAPHTKASGAMMPATAAVPASTLAATCTRATGRTASATAWAITSSTRRLCRISRHWLRAASPRTPTTVTGAAIAARAPAVRV